MTRPLDYGDQFPSDVGDVVPTDPISLLAKTNHGVDPVLFKPYADVIEKFNPQNDAQKEEKVPRTVFWGYIVAEAGQPTDNPRTYKVILQHGLLVTAGKQTQLTDDVFHVGQTVTVIAGQNKDEWIIISPTYMRHAEIQWVQLQEDLKPGDFAKKATLMSWGGGWTAGGPAAGYVTIADPLKKNCLSSGETCQVVMMKNQSCIYEIVGSNGLTRLLTNTGTVLGKDLSRDCAIKSSTTPMTVNVVNKLRAIPKNIDFWARYNTMDNIWYVIQTRTKAQFIFGTLISATGSVASMTLVGIGLSGEPPEDSPISLANPQTLTGTAGDGCCAVYDSDADKYNLLFTVCLS